MILPRPRWIVLLCAVASGLLLTAGYAPFSQAWCGWIALGPMSLGLMYGARSWRAALVAGYVSGAVHFGTSLFWINEVTTLGWFALTLYLGLYPALWALVWWLYVQRARHRLTSVLNISRALFGASAWVLLEWIRGWLFSGFPWNDLGVTQHEVIGIIQIAELGGVLLLSWLVAFVSLSIALTLARMLKEIKREPTLKNRWEFTLAMGLAALSFIFGVKVVLEKPDYPVTLHYLAIQPNLPQDPWGRGVSMREAMAKLQVLSISGLSDPGASGRVDLVIWPETPVPEEIYADPGFNDLLKSLTVDRGESWLFGSNYFAGGKVYNSAFLFNPGVARPGIYSKNHLVIFGEYTPLADVFPIIRKLTPLGMDFSPGTEAALLYLNRPALKIAPLICFEDALPQAATAFARQQPDLFINITNDGWFNRSAQSRQHLANAVFRTIEHRRPMLRVTNSGVTAAISEKGVVTNILKDDATGSTYISGYKKGDLGIPRVRTTFYELWGDWIVWLSLALVLACIFHAHFDDRRIGAVAQR
ncbi:MAG: apolipoprotein N-acyltransferase [Methylacidiphilales bacterium]|nr:apolipoprotein N-acyltransferase [Candidatus Methylacidiphilales bacterium]